MRRVLFAAVLLLGTLPADASPMLEKLFGCTSRICTIANNAGGVVREFEAARAEAETQGVRIRIVGFCASACESVIARSPNACAGPRATFVAHRAVSYLQRNIMPGLPTFTGDEHAVTPADIGIRPCPRNANVAD
jgi:hypothetical protein